MGKELSHLKNQLLPEGQVGESKTYWTWRAGY
jgi:hypothetical protein